MSELDTILHFAEVDRKTYVLARAELAALRARVAELEKPKTCETCDWYGKHGKACQNPHSPTYAMAVPPEFFCSNHAPEPTA